MGVDDDCGCGMEDRAALCLVAIWFVLDVSESCTVERFGCCGVASEFSGSRRSPLRVGGALPLGGALSVFVAATSFEFAAEGTASLFAAEDTVSMFAAEDTASLFAAEGTLSAFAAEDEFPRICVGCTLSVFATDRPTPLLFPGGSLPLFFGEGALSSFSAGRSLSKLVVEGTVSLFPIEGT